MLDAETKRRIDTARDILVGKLPDPMSQVEQITIALIYKFMDDMDAEAEEMGGKRTFFSGEFERYGWASLMDVSLGGNETLNRYAEGIEKMNQNPNIPQFFRDIFKNAFLPYRDPVTLKMFLKTINEFKYDHSERLGDAFEYLLSIMSSQGDAGQFRTPRHIIDFMVALVDPKKEERVLDPACGTAGFLISAYRHILTVERENAAKGQGMTPDERKRLMENFEGYDISPDMVRLSSVNMYLHGFSTPKIHEYDTLTSEERWNDFADVILANPPFMTPKGGIRPHKQFSIKTNRSEALFLDYILEHLNPDGRAAVIVPEGINFAVNSGYIELRTRLIEGNSLLVDITLPHGVFKPYASVKTHILIIDKKIAKKANSILFIEIENDGFSQSDTREPISGSQLPNALKEAETYKTSLEKNRIWNRSQIDLRSYEVSRELLKSTKEKHLLGRWHDLPNRVIHKADVPLVRIIDLCNIKNGLTPNMATAPGENILVVPAEERKSSDHWDFEGKGICIPLVSSAGHGKAEIKRIHYEEGRFALATTMCTLFVKDENIIRPRFLHIFLEATCNELLVPLMCGATNITLNSNQLRNVLIPVPEISKQDQVIESYVLHKYATLTIVNLQKLYTNSGDLETRKYVDEVIRDIENLLERTKKWANISSFLPNC